MYIHVSVTLRLSLVCDCFILPLSHLFSMWLPCVSLSQMHTHSAHIYDFRLSSEEQPTVLIRKDAAPHARHKEKSIIQ